MSATSRSPLNRTPLSRVQVVHLAWPIILSNLSTPLLGIVDTAVIGNLGDPALIGAIAIGALVFSFLYWGFGFLRMGTTALVAQAAGAGDYAEVKATCYRAGLVAAAIGFALLLLQIPIGTLAFQIIDGSPRVEAEATTYFTIRILGAPFSLALLVVMGFLLGSQQTKRVLLLNLLLNGTNILLDIVFVMGLGWDVAGVAAATVIAEVLAFTAGTVMVVQGIKARSGSLRLPRATLFHFAALRRMFIVNRDLMIRTLCLLFAFAWFTNQGAQQGDIILASNAILMQFVSFAAFFLDGFALAAETLVGGAIGAREPARLAASIRFAMELGGITSLGLSLIFLLFGTLAIDLLTNVTAVQATARIYFPWAVAAPIISVWCYLLDGIFIGATRTVEMRNAMIISLGLFLGSWFAITELLPAPMLNHGLWLVLLVYFLARAGSLAFFLPRITTLRS